MSRLLRRLRPQKLHITAVSRYGAMCEARSLLWMCIFWVPKDHKKARFFESIESVS